MANEFERHIAMEPEEDEQSKGSDMYSQAKDQVSKAARGASENMGAISTTAILFGVAGFALGWACGQSSAERYWR